MQARGIHHVDLVVSDVERSKAFYSTLLQSLGWSGALELEGERGEEIWYLQAADTWLGLRQKQSDAHAVPYDRYAVGVHHVAFEASTREAVDRCWQWILEQGVEVERAPRRSSGTTSRGTTRRSSTTQTGSSSKSSTSRREPRRRVPDPACPKRTVRCSGDASRRRPLRGSLYRPADRRPAGGRPAHSPQNRRLGARP